MKRHLAILLAASMAGLGTAALAAAPSVTPAPTRCTCMSPKRPPCEVWWQTPAIFVGEAQEIETIEEETADGVSRSRLVTLEVQEVFRGVDDDEVEVRTGAGGGDCGFDFEEDGRYLVYANRSRISGRLQTGICSRTAAVEDAAYDLSYLRGLDEMERTVSLYGMVYRERPEIEIGEERPAGLEAGGTLPDTTLVIEGQRRRVETRSDSEGWYEINGLPPGRYEIRVEAEGVGPEDRWRVRIPRAPACLWRNLIVPPAPRDG